MAEKKGKGQAEGGTEEGRESPESTERERSTTAEATKKRCGRRVENNGGEKDKTSERPQQREDSHVTQHPQPVHHNPTQTRQTGGRTVEKKDVKGGIDEVN